MNNKTLIRVFLPSIILFYQFAHGVQINVADHGIVPGKDVTMKVNQLLESLKGQKNVKLVFPKGRYEFFPENAVEAWRAVTNHDNSMKRMAFTLFGFEGLTLDGNGSTFIFNGRMSPIVIEGSTGTTLKNFKIDWDTPFHHELTVVERDTENNAFIAKISPMKYGFEVKNGQLLLNHYNWQDTLGQNIAFDPRTNAPTWMTRSYALRVRPNTKITKVSPNRIRCENLTMKVPPIGTVMCTYGNAPTNRLAQAIHVSSSKDTTIENVTVYAGGGMALICERAENVTLNRFVVTSTDERTMATRADATHFLGCKGLIKLENCLFEHMADDGINVHGAYIKIEKYMGDKTFLCEISHRQQVGLVFAEPGDRVMVTSRETVLPIYETTVEKVKIINENRLLVSVADVPKKLPDGPLSLENITWYPDLVMRNNIIRDNRARSALITTKGKVLVENNFFSSMMHGILIEGDNKSWYESGGVRDITIRNNTFENIGYGSNTGYPLYASPMLLPEQRLGDDQYHRNIRFTGNTIRSFNGHVVHALSVEGLEISGNIIEMSKDYPNGSETASIELEYCEDVTIENNQFRGFAFPVRVDQADDCKNVQIRKNKGLN
jgi:polygalacturonase